MKKIRIFFIKTRISFVIQFPPLPHKKSVSAARKLLENPRAPDYNVGQANVAKTDFRKACFFLKVPSRNAGNDSPTLKYGARGFFQKFPRCRWAE